MYVYHLYSHEVGHVSYASRGYQDAKQVIPAIGPLMEGIWITEFRGLYGLHRTAVVMLADVGIELGMAKSAAKSIEACLPQVSQPS